jgi:hypothetical protein
MAHVEPADFDHGQNGGRFGKFDFRPLHHHFHLRCHGNAVIRKELRRYERTKNLKLKKKFDTKTFSS